MKKKLFVIVLAVSMMLSACGGKEEVTEENVVTVTPENKPEENVQTDDLQAEKTQEENPEFSVDIAALAKENEDAFAWIRIPGTSIDYPVYQSGISDDYYENHDKNMKESDEGALYIEMANMMDMCDFNTVIHGKSQFNDLYNYTDADFFDKHGTVYVFLDGNVLTYQVFAAYERDNTSLIRTYDFSYISGCQQFLDDLYTKEMGKNILEGWGPITPYNFCITLTTQLGENSDKQYVVVAALVNDEAGTVDREFME